MRISKIRFGYNPDQVQKYVSLLETEMMLIAEQIDKEDQDFLQTEEKLLTEIDELRLQLNELEQLKKSLH